MTPPPAPLSKSQRRKRNKLKAKLKEDDIKPEANIPEPLTAHPTPPVNDGQHEAAITEAEDRLDAISESDSEDNKTSSPAIELISKRIRFRNKKASRIASYALKPPSELNEDQKKSVAMLPIILANITELEGMRKAIESAETERVKEFEKRQVEEEKAMQERIDQAVSDTKAAHLKSPGPSPFPLNPNAHRIIQLVAQSLTSFSKGSQKDEVLSGLLKGEGEFEGLTYQTILVAADVYRNSQIIEELTNVPDSKSNMDSEQVAAELEPDAVDDDGPLKAGSSPSARPDDRGYDSEPRGRGRGGARGARGGKRGRGRGRGRGGAGSEPRDPTDPNNATNMNTPAEDASNTTAETKGNGPENNAKGQADFEELKRKLERDREEEARKRKEEEIRQAEIEESKRKLAELERDRHLWEEAARKRMQQEQIEESRRKLEKLERDKPLWEEAARKRKEQELREEEEERIRVVKEKEEAAKRLHLEQQELEQKAQERERKKQWRRVTMSVHTKADQWTSEDMLRRYTGTATRFDVTKYTMVNPLKFQSIPWPIILRGFAIEEITWKAVEEFFKLMEDYLPSGEYEDLVDKSHKRFHPDRWRSRRILTSIKDDLEREILEEAGSVVAQALTPLWKRVTGRE